MTAKPTRPDRLPARPSAKSATPPRPAAADLRQRETRWQRTVRYGWDKGGSHGGR